MFSIPRVRNTRMATLTPPIQRYVGGPAREIKSKSHKGGKAKNMLSLFTNSINICADYTKKNNNLILQQCRTCCCCSVTKWRLTLCDSMAQQASLSFTISCSWPKLMSIESVMSFNHLILCWPLLLPSIFPSISQLFSNELALCIWWPEYCSFSFTTNPSNEHFGFISFRIDWFYVLVVQAILKILL